MFKVEPTYQITYIPRKPIIEVNIGKLTIFLILICFFMYFLSKAYPSLIYSFSFSKNEFLRKPWTILTSAFLHANATHLFYNLLSLFIFGNMLEIKYGSKFLFLIFLISVIVGNIGFAIFSDGATIGISGAVFGFIGASVILMPNARVPFPVGSISVLFKVWFAGPLMAIGELLLSFISFDNIAHTAHFFGFIAGMIIAFVRKMSH